MSGWPLLPFVIGPFVIRNPRKTLKNWPRLYAVLRWMSDFQERVEFGWSERRLAKKKKK